VKKKITKLFSQITEFLNDIRDTSKYPCVYCQRLWFKYQLIQLNPTFKKYILSFIIFINIKLQLDNMLICRMKT
jgi:hypothetical protein